MPLASKLKPKNPEAQKLHFRYYRLKVPMVRVRNLGCLDCSKGRARHQNHVTWDADRKSTETLGSSYYSCPQGFVGIVDGRSQSSTTPFNQTLNPKPYSRRDSSDGRRKKAFEKKQTLRPAARASAPAPEMRPGAQRRRRHTEQAETGDHGLKNDNIGGLGFRGFRVERHLTSYATRTVMFGRERQP